MQMKKNSYKEFELRQKYLPTSFAKRWCNFLAAFFFSTFLSYRVRCFIWNHHERAPPPLNFILMKAVTMYVQTANPEGHPLSFEVQPTATFLLPSFLLGETKTNAERTISSRRLSANIHT